MALSAWNDEGRQSDPVRQVSNFCYGPDLLCKGQIQSYRHGIQFLRPNQFLYTQTIQILGRYYVIVVSLNSHWLMPGFPKETIYSPDSQYHSLLGYPRFTFRGGQVLPILPLGKFQVFPSSKAVLVTPLLDYSRLISIFQGEYITLLTNIHADLAPLFVRKQPRLDLA